MKLQVLKLERNSKKFASRSTYIESLLPSLKTLMNCCMVVPGLKVDLDPKSIK